MKHFVLITAFTISVAVSFSQGPTYSTAANGAFNSDATWVNGGVGGGTPPTTGNCNCKIVIKAGHRVTFTANMTINDVAFVLDGALSELTFNNNVDVVFGGTSSIDLQNSSARIFKGNNNNNITLGGQVIYDGQTTKVNSTVGGEVKGLASASSTNASPQFQTVVLPVVLSDFNVTEKEKSVAVSWKTSSETNFSHFIIERSNDNKTWNNVGSVHAQKSHGADRNYTFTDNMPANGVNLYRLKLVDIDSKFEYSNIKSVNIAVTTLKVLAGPNPASSFLNIKVSSPGGEPYRVRLINRSGQVVFDQKYASSGSQQQLNVANFADGSYFLEVTKGSSLKQINKIMIVRK